MSYVSLEFLTCVWAPVSWNHVFLTLVEHILQYLPEKGSLKRKFFEILHVWNVLCYLHTWLVFWLTKLGFIFLQKVFFSHQCCCHKKVDATLVLNFLSFDQILLLFFHLEVPAVLSLCPVFWNLIMMCLDMSLFSSIMQHIWWVFPTHSPPSVLDTFRELFIAYFPHLSF